MSKEKTIELYYDFSDYINGKKDIPKKFLKTDPLRKYVTEESEIIYKLYDSYKNGPQDLDPKNIFPKDNIDSTQETALTA